MPSFSGMLLDELDELVDEEVEGDADGFIIVVNGIYGMIISDDENKVFSIWDTYKCMNIGYVSWLDTVICICDSITVFLTLIMLASILIPDNGLL